MSFNSRLSQRSKLFGYTFLTLVVLVIIVVELHLTDNKINIQLHLDGLADRSNKSCKAAKVLTTSDARTLPKLPPLEFYMDALFLKSPRRNDSFDPQMNATELTAYINLLWAFLDLCEEHKIDVMLQAGTLLGSYRHHGFIPWDDDVDLMVEASDMNLLTKLIANNSFSEFAIVYDGCWRLWNKSACFTNIHNNRNWCWPFIDITPYRLKDHIVHPMGQGAKHLLSFMFPMHKRPFMGRWINSPRDALGFIGNERMPTDYCLSLHFSHKFFITPESREYAKCSSLRETYPFIIRNQDRNTYDRNGQAGVFETLYGIDGCPLYTVFVEESALNIHYSILPNSKEEYTPYISVGVTALLLLALCFGSIAKAHNIAMTGSTNVAHQLPKISEQAILKLKNQEAIID